MMSKVQKIEDIDVVESQRTVEDETSKSYRDLTKRVLWKFDIHVLPPLAFVRLCHFILFLDYDGFLP